MRKAEDKLVVFLYVLAREHLPTGKIEQLLTDHIEGHDLEPVFSSPQLESLARDWERRLTTNGADMFSLGMAKGQIERHHAEHRDEDDDCTGEGCDQCRGYAMAYQLLGDRIRKEVEPW
jgi:hypothetical protein